MTRVFDEDLSAGFGTRAIHAGQRPEPLAGAIMTPVYLTSTYVQMMRKSVREQLQTASRSLTQPESAYAMEIAAVLREPDNAPPERLRTHAEKLKRFEDSLESA